MMFLARRRRNQSVSSPVFRVERQKTQRNFRSYLLPSSTFSLFDPLDCVLTDAPSLKIFAPHKEIDRLEIKIEALQEENAELRLKKNGVEIDTVIGADDMLPPGLSADEVIDYQKTH